jgi:hypothetical protein
LSFVSIIPNFGSQGSILWPSGVHYPRELSVAIVNFISTPHLFQFPNWQTEFQFKMRPIHRAFLFHENLKCWRMLGLVDTLNNPTAVQVLAALKTLIEWAKSQGIFFARNSFRNQRVGEGAFFTAADTAAARR